MRLPLSRWLLLAGLLLVCGLLVGQLLVLRSSIDSSRNFVLELRGLSEMMANYEAVEMEAIYGPSGHRAQTSSRLQQLQQQLAGNLDRLLSYQQPGLDLTSFMIASSRYDRATREQTAYLLAGDLKRAHLEDDTVVDPACQSLTASIDALLQTEEQLTHRSIRQAKLRLAVLALIGVSVVAMLLYLAARQQSLKDERKALSYSEKRFRLLTEGSSDVVLIVDPAGMIQYASPSIQGVLGVSAERACSKSLLDLAVADDRAVITEHLRAATQGKDVRVEFRGMIGEDKWIYLEAAIRDLTATKEIGGLLVNLRDVDDQKRANTQLLHAALHDGLTGLPNRILFGERLQAILERLPRDDGRSVAVLFIDIDDFKVINDSVGHQIGDMLILEVSQRLMNSVRRTDTVGRLHASKGVIARLGGDEFTIMLDDIRDAADAVRVCERIQAAMGQPFLLGKGQFYASVSIGVAVSSEDCTAEDLMRNADVAMYRAKSHGKARYAIFDMQMHERVTARLRLETDLRMALEKGQFMLYYQPIVCLRSGHIRRVEALLRWNHDGEIVLPGHFIAAAEDCGLIRPIGDWVLHEACRQAALWNKASAEPLIVCVNISGKQFTHPTFLEEVIAAIAESGVRPEHLEFEITEGVAMGDAEKTRLTLEQLRSLGVQLALDDFGTGYSSLSYLRRFTVNTLKIDRSFICDLPSNRDNLAIVQTIIELARVLGLETVAEGIETKEQLETLRGFGCSLAQGFLLDRPEPPNAPPWPTGMQLIGSSLVRSGGPAGAKVQDAAAAATGRS